MISDKVTCGRVARSIDGASYDVAGGISTGERAATPLNVTLKGKLPA